MTRFAAISLALLFAAPTPALGLNLAEQASPGEAPQALGASPADGPEVARQIAQCEGETFVFAWGAGASPTKVTLCSDKGASPEKIVRMLEDAAAKIEQATGIAEDRRLVLAQQMRGKIAEVKARQAPEAVAPAAANEPEPKIKSANVSAGAVSPRLRVKPRLVLNCYNSGDGGSGAPCETFDRDTRLILKAGEVIPGGMTLRFSRRGQHRAELPLGPMREGQLARLAVPREVCSGILQTRIQIDVVRDGQAVDTHGPYTMRC